MAKNTKRNDIGKKMKTQAEKVTVPKKRKIIITVSIVLSLALVAGLVIGFVSCNGKNKEVDYINDDLSKFVYISENDYKNFPVTSTLITVDESDVRVEINKLLVANKSKEALYDGASVRPLNYTIRLGDVVNIWYRAYTIDENGIKTEVAGTSNLQSGKPHALEIGSGSFIKGFEEGLIGKALQDKSLEIVKEGKVREGDTVYISYSAFLPSGTPTQLSNVRIDLSDKAAVDKVYGKGFADFLVGKTIAEGKGETGTFRIEGENVDTVYYEMKVDYAVRSDVEPYLLDLEFPVDYKEASFRGLKVTFEVYASTAILYNTPEWNDKFITETLKETNETLSAYAGTSLVEKYENKIRAEIQALADEANKSLIEEDMFRHYLSKVKVKRLPKAEVRKMYNQYVSDAESLYSIYSSSFKSFDEFAKYYFELSANEKWQDFVMKKAEEAVTERLVFYYIIREEGIIPTGEEYERLYNQCKQEHLRYYTELYKSELEACKTEEEKAAKLSEIEARMLSYYGEQYFNELTYYKYGLDKLVGFAALK